MSFFTDKHGIIALDAILENHISYLKELLWKEDQGVQDIR